MSATLTAVKTPNQHAYSVKAGVRGRPVQAAKDAHRGRLTQSVISNSFASCDAALAAAAISISSADRYIHAHLAAVRAARAYLKLVDTSPPRGVPRSTWDRLAVVAPTLAIWAAYFAAETRTRKAVEAGDPISERDADDLLGLAEDFRDELVRAAYSLAPAGGRWAGDSTEDAGLVGGWDSGGDASAAQLATLPLRFTSHLASAA